jgi:hypothetical protein
MKKELKRKNEDNNGKKDLEIWEEKKRASAKEDGLKSERNLPVHQEDFLAMYVKKPSRLFVSVLGRPHYIA